jgi:hypothetical protein
MFGFLQRRKLRVAEDTLRRVTFLSKVAEMRRTAGFPEANLSPENLIAFFAINLADGVSLVSRGSTGTDVKPAFSERAATVILFVRAAHVGVANVGIKDPDVASSIYQSGFDFLMGLGDGIEVKEAEAAISSSMTIYDAIKGERLDLLEEIDRGALAYLDAPSQPNLTRLVDCWEELKNEVLQRMRA